MFGSKAFLTALVFLHVVQFSEGKTWWKRYAGYCNAASSNCGAGCNVDSDCPGGACWADMDDCSTSGYCNAASSNCTVPDAIYKVIAQVAIAGPTMTTAAHHQDIVMQHPATVVPGVALTGSVQVVRVGQTMTTAAHHQDIVMQRLATVVPGVIQPVIVRVVIAGKTWTTAVAPPQEITLWEHTSGCCREEYLLLHCPLYRAR